MKIVYIGHLPQDCRLFNFAAEVGESEIARKAAIEFLGDNSFKLPWQLRGIIKNTLPEEKIIVHTSTPRGIMATADALSLERGREVKIVFMPEVAEGDSKDLKRLGKYGSSADCLLFTDSAIMAATTATWGAKTPSYLLAPVASAPGEEKEAGFDGLKLLFQGEITRDCHLAEAVKVLSESPEMKMIVNGSGKGRWAMPVLRLSRSLGTEPRVKWQGEGAKDTIYPADGDTLFLSTESDTPERACALASYMAQGAVAIAIDTPMNRGIVTDGVDGFLLRAFTVGALSELTARLAGDAQLRHSVSEAARAKAEAFSKSNFFNSLLNIYESL